VANDLVLRALSPPFSLPIFNLPIEGKFMTSARATWNEADYTTPDADRFARDEETVRRGFWKKARRVAAGLPFAEDLLAAYYCAFDRETPMQVKAALVGALAYFVLPFDFVPDVMPILGFADDAAVLATALRMVAGHMRPEHREAAKRALERGLAG
jgi:uncharacterized membrane protein YkvA (DUF1232 family)